MSINEIVMMFVFTDFLQLTDEEGNDFRCRIDFYPLALVQGPSLCMTLTPLYYNNNAAVSSITTVTASLGAPTAISPMIQPVSPSSQIEDLPARTTGFSYCGSTTTTSSPTGSMCSEESSVNLLPIGDPSLPDRFGGPIQLPDLCGKGWSQLAAEGDTEFVEVLQLFSSDDFLTAPLSIP